MSFSVRLDSQNYGRPRIVHAFCMSALMLLVAGLLVPAPAAAEEEFCNRGFENSDCWQPQHEGVQSIDTTFALSGTKSAKLCGVRPCNGA